jgi:hypothetical protein
MRAGGPWYARLDQFELVFDLGCQAKSNLTIGSQKLAKFAEPLWSGENLNDWRGGVPRRILQDEPG